MTTPSRAGGIAFISFTWICDTCEAAGCCSPDDVPREHAPDVDIPLYSSSLDAAWIVVEHIRKTLLLSKREQFLRELQLLVTDVSDQNEPYAFIAWPDVFFFITPAIICQAALKVVDAEL